MSSLPKIGNGGVNSEEKSTNTLHDADSLSDRGKFKSDDKSRTPYKNVLHEFKVPKLKHIFVNLTLEKIFLIK